MSNAAPKSRPCQRSIREVHYCLKRREMTARPLARRPADPSVRLYSRQVAGHTATEDDKYLGLLQCSNGTILKPILKESQKREVEFYSRLASSPIAELAELRRLVPRFYGTTRHTYGGHTLEYIMLEDLAERMLEPCIMDVKIGRRTWDPLASEEKISSEQSKYALCKQQYAFCIPGYQVYRPGARLVRYNKDHGKKLHGLAVKDAIRNYLNGSGGRPLCRALVLQLVTALWRVQRWARRQTSLRLYSASLLLIYDAQRALIQDTPFVEWCSVSAPAPVPRPRRRHSMHAGDLDSSFSGQLSLQGPVFKKLTPAPTTPLSLAQSSFTPHPPQPQLTETWERLAHNHSFDHNYEDKLSKIKMNYRAMLDQLSYDSPNPNPWGTVKIIDFAHAFYNDEDDRAVDDNFREGVENLVEIFEGFLSETDDQVI